METAKRLCALRLGSPCIARTDMAICSRCGTWYERDPGDRTRSPSGEMEDPGRIFAGVSTTDEVCPRCREEQKNTGGAVIFELTEPWT
jgi:hypothetical protein